MAKRHWNFAGCMAVTMAGVVAFASGVMWGDSNWICRLLFVIAVCLFLSAAKNCFGCARIEQRRELAELRRDKARLDWLEGKAVPWDAEWHFPAIVWADYEMELRGAIDDAMKEGRG